VRADSALAYIENAWSTDIVPVLHDFIRIPNVSPAFDVEWADHGHMHDAVALVTEWCRSRAIAGLRVGVQELPGRTPLVVCEVPAFGGSSADDSVVLYGHLDKQPEMTGWRNGFGPWSPVVEGDRLYGRGGGDDGYAAFAALTAIELVQASGGAHARCLVLVEASEESGSPDLPAHLAALSERVGSPSLVICLDSGCLDYDRLWYTTSLRGVAGVTLRIDILDEGVHSGQASGIVPSSFRIARSLLSRLEDEATGEMLLPELVVSIPPERLAEAEATAAELDGLPSDEFTFVGNAGPTTPDPVEQLIRRTWRPTLAITGADGLPSTARAGNVLRPFTALQLSVRLPPTCDADGAVAAIERALTTDPPYGARVTVGAREASTGWSAPLFAPWLRDSLERASRDFFGAPAGAHGEGGSIPFMGMLGRLYPGAQFVTTGVLGPHSNAHGPNEFLDLPTARKLTGVVARVLADHAARD
jgi:acetylornithine deacetylase/succinyl-diaminopimelate desuccinylase-like protein